MGDAGLFGPDSVTWRVHGDPYGLPALPTTDLGASLAGRAVRRTALSLPRNLAQSPAYRDALARVAA